MFVVVSMLFGGALREVAHHAHGYGTACARMLHPLGSVPWQSNISAVIARSPAECPYIEPWADLTMCFDSKDRCHSAFSSPGPSIKQYRVQERHGLPNQHALIVTTCALVPVIN
jgi:hypothetical protein